MSLICEDGSGMATAESYCTVAFASAYFTARAVTAWGALAFWKVRHRACTGWSKSKYLSACLVYLYL
jgi:hypothetical protein